MQVTERRTQNLRRAVASMRGHALVVALVLCLLPPVFAQSPTAAVAQIDARAEVAAALFAAAATQAASERAADAKLRAQRQEIEGLRAQVRGGAAQLRVALTAAEEKYVAALAARDRVYAQEIAVFRAAVEDIAKTPEGVAALARFNAGDEVGALAVLDDLRAARDAARKKRADVESAAEARRIATLALEARTRSKVTTAQVISRFEEVTRLDPGVFWDWAELMRLYLTPDVCRTRCVRGRRPLIPQPTKGIEPWRSINWATCKRVQGNLTAALASYRASHRGRRAPSANRSGHRRVAARPVGVT